MHKREAERDQGGHAKEKAPPGNWIGVLTALFISLALWGAVILIGQEMIRRLDIEIAQGIEAFR